MRESSPGVTFDLKKQLTTGGDWRQLFEAEDVTREAWVSGRGGRPA